MKDSQLKFDRTCHVLYSRPCKRQIQEKIALHYPADEREAVWTRVQIQYENFLADWRTDLGGKKNFHNGRGGTYDCIALMAYYVVCRDVTSLAEIEKMEGSLFLPAFREAALREREPSVLQEAAAPRFPERQKALRQMGRLRYARCALSEGSADLL